MPDTFLGPDPRFLSLDRLTPAEGWSRFQKAQERKDRKAIEELLLSSRRTA